MLGKYMFFALANNFNLNIIELFKKKNLNDNTTV
jgi:hypothetical protein